MDNSSGNDMDLIHKYWKQLLALVFVTSIIGGLSHSTLQAEDKNREQDEILKEIQEKQAESNEKFNEASLRNSLAIKQLAKEINANVDTTKRLLEMLLEQQRRADGNN